MMISTQIDQMYEGYIEHMKRINDIMNGHIIETPILRNEMVYLAGKNLFQTDVCVDNHINYRIMEKTLRMIVQNSPQDQSFNDCILCSEKISNKDLLSCGHYAHNECLSTICKTACPVCEEEILTAPQPKKRKLNTTSRIKIE